MYPTSPRARRRLGCILEPLNPVVRLGSQGAQERTNVDLLIVRLDVHTTGVRRVWLEAL